MLYYSKKGSENMNNKIIKCENDFVLSLTKNYSANELKTLSSILFKMTSMLAIEEKNDSEDVTGVIEEDGTLKVSIKFNFFNEILYKSKLSFKEVENICTNLLNIKFEYYSKINNSNLYNCIPIFKRISKDEDARTFYFELNNYFNEFLIGMKSNFTLYELNEFKELSKSHAQQIYLIGRRYINVNDGRLRVKLDTFRSMLGINGKYEKISDLEKLINRSIKSVNLNTDLKVQWFKEKEGRNIKYLNFVFKYNKELYIKK